jgi:serine acetyltransferase
VLVEGVNDRVQLSVLRAEMNRRILETWMREGVTVVDPATTWVDVDVELERDVTLLPGTQLHGATVVREGATVGPDTTLTDVEVGPRASVVRTHGTLAVVGADASVGPFAYLRPGTVLGEQGKIGTFVETKNAQIGTGSKIPHLSYVGDATIGEHTNIGAASVTVNYDGVNKHHTTIGSYARTGADNMFVAPVSVGDGAYTGAGSVIRRDVPSGALGVSAGAQRNIEGWVSRARAGTAAAKAVVRPVLRRRALPAGPRRARPRRRSIRRRTPDPAACTAGLLRLEPEGLRTMTGIISSDGEKRLVLLTGRAHPIWPTNVATHLGIDLLPTTTYEFANGEIYTRFGESVRGADTFVLQSHSSPINTWIMEQLLMVDALKRASAKTITVVAPFYGYARQDKKHRGREPISGAASWPTCSRRPAPDRLMSVDLHAAQIQGFFDGPVDHLWAMPILTGVRAQPSRHLQRHGRLARRRAASASPSSGPPSWAGVRWRSCTRRATSAAPTRRSPTAWSVTSRAAAACSSTTSSTRRHHRRRRAGAAGGRRQGRHRRRAPHGVPVRPRGGPPAELRRPRGRHHGHPADRPRTAGSPSSPCSPSPR